MTFIPKIQLHNFNIQVPAFRQAAVSNAYSIYGDTFIAEPQRQELSEKEIEAKARANPEICRIMKENNIPLKVNIKSLRDLQHGHLKDARIIAAKIYSALPPETKEQISMQDLQQAALLHDYGKILIPEKILNKNGKLNEEERKIMELHPILGYELLKNEGISPEVLNLIKYHHQNPAGTGYPQIDADYQPSLALEILHLADEYSALREKRPYKPELTEEEALEVIKKDMEAGNISPAAYEALLKAV